MRMRNHSGHSGKLFAECPYSRNSDEFVTRVRRKRIAQIITNRLVIAGLIAAALASIGIWSYIHHEIEVAPTVFNQYFKTGGVWDHNDEVSARLERCAVLGLLRNTSVPLPPLPEEEEQALIAKGCGTNETTIILLVTLWASEAYSGRPPAGEVIYAQSMIQTLNANNYAFMFSNLGWYNADMAKTVEIWHKHRWNTRLVIGDPEHVTQCWKDKACLKTDSNLDGIETWRLLSFTYWDL
jgi:hypothetical protein